jgi:putative PEP-CTERM system TPR-repeat lipoprotein
MAKKSSYVRLLRFAVLVALSVSANACFIDSAARKERHFENGNRYFQEGRFEEASIEFRSAVQIDPKYGPARAKLAETFERLGNTANAFREFTRAADVLPNDASVQLKVGHYLLAAGQMQQALARADAALKLVPDSVEAHILRGNALAGQNDFDKAMREIEEAIRLDPARGASYTQLGFAEFARGRHTEAEAALKKAVALSPDAIDPRLALANFFISTGRVQDAEGMFHSAWTLNPRHEGANRAMAASALASGKIAEAENHLKTLAEISPKHSSQFPLTDYYVATGRATEAIERLRQLELAHPDAADVKERLARAFGAAGDMRKAEALIDALLKSDPRNGSAQLFKGQLLAEAGRQLEALGHLQHAAEAEPSSIAARFALGKLYAAQGDFARAEQTYREVLTLNPRAGAAHAELAHVQLLGGSARAALQTAESAADKLPESLTVRVALIRGLLAAGNLNRAESEIATLLAQHPNLAAAHVQHAVLAAERKDVSGARAAFGQAMRLDPQSLEAFAGMLMLDIKARDFASAKTRLGHRLASGKPTPELLLLAGRTYAAANDLKAAEDVLQQAIAAQPNHVSAYGTLAQVYLVQNEVDHARQQFDRLAERQKNPSTALTMAGTILQMQGQHGEARKRFERALAVDPRAGVAANNLAWIAAESGELDKALQLAHTAATVMADVPAILDTLGWIYYKKNLPALAIPPLARSVVKDPNNSLYHYHLGLAQIQGGDSPSGRKSLERALELQSTFSGADDARRILAGLDRT